MKIAINNCYGGFSLSPAGVKRMSEIQGRECYFFRNDKDDHYVKISMEEAKSQFIWWAFDIQNPNDENYEQHYLDNRPDNRKDQSLIQTIEELGVRANGEHARIKIVEIPDGVEYEIEEYDGIEWVAEKHRTWR